MKKGILEEKSLWYKYKTAVWLDDSSQTQTVHNIMRVLRAIHDFGPLAYVTVPITSGKYFYELKKRKPLMNEDFFFDKLVEHNYKIGWRLVKKIRKERRCSVLYPADLIPIHQKWGLEHFQALWLSIIAEKCTEHYMSEGWNFSNGGVEEFIHSYQLKLGLPRHESLLFFNTKESEEIERERMRNIKIYDHKRIPVSLNNGYKLIEKALEWIKEEGFGLTGKNAIRLQQCLSFLEWTGDMIEKGFYQ